MTVGDPARIPAEAYGAVRVLEPPGALPQAARRLDPTLALQPHELAIDVDTLALDSTSFAQIARGAGGLPERIAASIAEIVAAAGKMHNPVTGSGGILVGTVRAIGDAVPDPPAVGARVVTLASLTLTPLALDKVVAVDGGSAQVAVRGTAYYPWTAPWATCPDDLPLAAVLALLDVYGAASHTRALIGPDTGTVLVLGAGHAGLLALAAAADALPASAEAVVLDVDRVACERARSLGLCSRAVVADLRDPLAALRALDAAGVPRGDLTVVVVNSAGCEAASILLTADHGTVLFFSMATSFTQAALGAEGVSATARMLIGSGFAPDRGAYALGLLRGDDRLRRAFTPSHEESRR